MFILKHTTCSTNFCVASLIVCENNYRYSTSGTFMDMFSTLRLKK